MQIKSAADRDKATILAKARAEATTIRGDAEGEAKKYFVVLNENPELAIYLLKLRALESALTNNATLVLTPDTAPFDLLKNRSANVSSNSANNNSQSPSSSEPKLSENVNGQK